MPIPLRSDRSAWDTVDYPDLHARDIESGSALFHLPKNAQADQVPQWDGERWVPVDPPNGGGGGGDPLWYIAGRLGMAQNVGSAILVTRTATIEAVYLYMKERGTDGATTIDVKLNGNSIFPGTDQPSLSYDDVANYVKVIPTTTALIEGDLLTMDISEAAAGAADLTVVIALVSAASGSGGGSGDMLKEVYDCDNDGAVNNSELLDGHPASYFAAADHTHPGGGAGDMVKATYDQDDDGVVDSAENALALNGHPDTYFAAAYHTHPGGESHVHHAQSVHTIEGANLADTGVKPLRFYLYLPAAGATLTEILCAANTPPGSTALRIDIHKNGSSILGGAGYIEIGAGNNTGTISTFTSASLSNNDYFQVEIVQGDAAAADLSVHIRYTY